MDKEIQSRNGIEMNTTTQAALPNDHPFMIAWNQFKETDEFNTVVFWATSIYYGDGRVINPEQRRTHVEGAMWLALTKGIEIGTIEETLKATKKEFNIGDVVRLNSGGPAMTVTAIDKTHTDQDKNPIVLIYSQYINESGQPMEIKLRSECVKNVQ